MPTAYKHSADRLMVIIPDRLTDLINKGEVTARYYNPGELFKEVHIVLTNDDCPDLQAIQKTVGSAKLYLHNLPSGGRLFLRTAGWQHFLLRDWINAGRELANKIKPNLIRTHNNFLEGYLAKEIKKTLNIPYAVSLHGVWDRDNQETLRQKVTSFFRSKLEKQSLSNADAVIAVYQPIVRYARAYGGKNVHLIYNIVANDDIRKKTSYKLARPPRLITINRQLKEKNPENIIRAIKDIECQYLLVGNGAYHEYLKEVARQEGVESKVTFIIAMPNAQLCNLLADQDMMVSHCDYWGMSKTVIEASLAGLPIIINQHPVEPILEYEGDWLLTCANTPEAYREAIMSFLSDEAKRREYGTHAYDHAKATFDPELMEKKTVAIYRNLLGI